MLKGILYFKPPSSGLQSTFYYRESLSPGTTNALQFFKSGNNNAANTIAQVEGYTTDISVTNANFVTFTGYMGTGIGYVILGFYMGKLYHAPSNVGEVATLYTINKNGELIKTTGTPGIFTPIELHYGATIDTEIIIEASNVSSIEHNGISLTTFPTQISINNGDIINAIGKNPNHVLTINNGQNMKSVQDGTTVYNNFPAAIPISGNKTIIASGEDDKSITIDYTNTNLPIVTNT